MKKISKLILMATVGVAALATVPAMADDLGGTWSKERFQLRLRGIGVLPDSGGHTAINGTPEADNAYVPEFDITYFFTKNVAAELILATSKHDVKLKNSLLGASTDLGETWILPPVLTLQYHFTPEEQFSPYLGAGINYTLPYSEDAAGGAITDLKADGSFGWALQAGADYWLNDNWGLNIDVKKVWVDSDVKVNGTIDGELELDPLIVGAGVSYRF